jgi:hypothetical protein
MTWLILWFVLSVPVALLVAALIGLGNRQDADLTSLGELGPEMHDQTIVG